MEVQEFQMKLFGTDILGYVSGPPVSKAVVVLVHGFAEHAKRYWRHVVPALVDNGFAVLSYDNIGHGRSGGKRGHCPNYEALMTILTTMIDKAKQLYEGKKIYLYGHSMGGNLVLNHNLRHPQGATGIIATSPYLRLAFSPPGWKLVLGRLMLQLWPSITLPSGLDPKGISRIPEEVARYENDPLIFDQVSPMYSFPVIEAGEWALAKAKELKTPTFLLHGTADSIIDHKATVAFAEKSSQAQLHLFEGGYHELHNDACKDELLAAVLGWLKEQMEGLAG